MSQKQTQKEKQQIEKSTIKKVDKTYGCIVCDYEGTRNGCFYCGAFR